MLIGVYGESRVGKDTCAAILVKNLGFEQRNLANPIRSTLMHIFNSVRPDIVETVLTQGWDITKAKHPEAVTSMISLGQKMRDINPDIWLDACMQTPYTDLVVPDVRQPNEADYILSHGGELWKIERIGSKKLGMDGLLDDYEFAVTLQNNGTLQELETEVLEIMKERNG